MTGWLKQQHQQDAAAISSSRSSLITRVKGRISAFVSLFLRAFLIPIVAFGVPIWPFLALLCLVPVIGAL